MAKRIQVGGRIESKEVGGIVTGAAEILDDAKGKKQSVINGETDDELVRLDQSKQDNLTFDNAPTEGSDNPVKSGGVYAADKALSDAIEAILLLIPSAASALNKLVDTAMMNSSISTATATFRGTYNVVTDLELAVDATHEQIAAKLAQVVSEADNNDYTFVQVPVSAESTDIRRTERYKFNGTVWGYEYDLNTSGFTAAQWAAINSGITIALVGKLIGLPTSSELMALLGQKQDTLTFDNIPTSGSANPVKSGGVYSAINEEKTAREQLAQSVTGINGRLGNVEDVIPSGAAANNKLVANNSMEAYVTSIIEAITASFTIATADGHINLSLTQTNGRVASLTLTSSDIASAQALTALTGRVSTAESNITSLGGRMTTAESNITTINSNITSLGGRVSMNETDIANLQQLYNDLQQSKPEPVTALPSTGQQQGVIYRLAGTTSYSDYMWNGSSWVLMATYNNAVDPRPKKASQNLVTSGGVFDNMGALDVSELNATENPHTLAKYADLSAALAAVPTDYQKGGMSIKFIQSSDNKYVQYIYTGTSTDAADFTNTVNWQKMNLEDEVSQLGQKVVGDFYLPSAVKFDPYNSCIEELYINPYYLDNITSVDFKNYGGIFYCFSNSWRAVKEIQSNTNGDVIEIEVTTAGGNASVGDVIGYVIFKDIVTFRATDYGPANKNLLNLIYVSRLTNAPLVASYLQIKKEFPDTLPIYIPDASKSVILTYESCISELWINSNYGRSNGNFCFNNFGGIAYLYYLESVLIFQCQKNLTNYQNGDIIPLVVTNAGGNAAVGDIVGYVIFKDIATFMATDYGGSSIYLNPERVFELEKNRTIWNGIIVTPETVEQIVEEKMASGIEPILPSIIYAAVGVEMNIYNDTIALSMDKGLSSPTNYIVRWSCSKGTITSRGFRFIPQAVDVGDVSIGCYVYNTNGELVKSKSATIKVVSAQISSAKRVVFFGDSTGEGSASALYNDFNDASLYSGTKPTMLGIRGTTPKYEAFGGARWADYATEGRAAFRCQVSGVGAIALNSQYTNNGFTWTVVEVNVTEAVGNILITNDSLYSSTDAPQTNGTLVPVGGGDNIPYTGATKEAGNPLWHNGSIDFSHYRNTLGLGVNEKLDLVSFQLGLNGSHEAVTTTRQYIINLYNAAIADNPNCIFVVGLITGPASEIGAYGVNYGAGDWMGLIINFHKLRKLYVELVESGDYPNMKIATPNLNIDRYYGFPTGTRQVSARNTTQEQYHTNYVHPNDTGYAQIGDSFFSTYIALLNT